MADLPVPKAEAKPSSSELPTEAIEAAAKWFSHWMGASSVRRRDREYAREVLAAAGPILIAAGRAQAAADIRADRGSLHGLAWQERAAQLAEAGLPNALKLQSDGSALQETPED